MAIWVATIKTGRDCDMWVWRINSDMDLIFRNNGLFPLIIFGFSFITEVHPWLSVDARLVSRYIKSAQNPSSCISSLTTSRRGGKILLGAKIRGVFGLLVSVISFWKQGFWKFAEGWRTISNWHTDGCKFHLQIVSADFVLVHILSTSSHHHLLPF